MNDFILGKSPAKLNLFLKVKDKRPDGFHNIETVFEKISLFDDVYIYPKPAPQKIEVKCNYPGLPQDKNNIAYKAARIFLDKMNIKDSVQIRILKRIPPSSGMGGGSSNAAVVLKLLDSLFKTNLSDDEFVEIGERIGSDVPFFLKDCNFALGTLKGNKITKINTSLSLWHLLIYPDIEISTSLAYQLFDKDTNSLTKAEVDVKLLIQTLEAEDAEGVSKKVYNSFEYTIFRRFKNLEKIKNKLLDLGATSALLTGSGSTIYGNFFSRKEALNIKHKLGSNSSFPYVVQGPIRTFA